MTIRDLVRVWGLAVLLASTAVEAAVRTRVVEYRDGDTVLEGFLAWDDAVAGPRPAVLIAHQWLGLTGYEQRRARMLAGLGYVAFAADVYGKGVRPASPAEAGPLAGKYKSDPGLLRRRIAAALEVVRKQPQSDSSRVAAIGYCFGGTTVLELARSGAEVAAVVSFHGGLGTPSPAEAGTVKARVLACHGADDPFVPAAEVAGFGQEMRAAGVDWQLIAYGGAVHSFTQPEADGSFNPGAKYHEPSDRRSWIAMKAFLEEAFR